MWCSSRFQKVFAFSPALTCLRRSQAQKSSLRQQCAVTEALVRHSGDWWSLPRNHKKACRLHRYAINKTVWFLSSSSQHSNLSCAVPRGWYTPHQSPCCLRSAFPSRSLPPRDVPALLLLLFNMTVRRASSSVLQAMQWQTFTSSLSHLV